MPRTNVVITGLGVVSSIGIGSEVFFQALVEKRSGIKSLSQRTDDGAKPGVCREPAGLWIGGPIIDFDPKQYVRPRKALKVMCREIQTAFAASQIAIENAGLCDRVPADPAGELKPQDIGTVFGGEMYYGPPTEMEDAIRGCIREDGTINGSLFGGIAMKKVLPLWMLKYLPNMPACHVGISINAHGPNNSLILGDVSGPAAMIEAASCIDRGNAQVMITGASGTRINTTRMNYRNDLPIADVCDPIENSSRPHDRASKGVVGGEAAVALVLEHVDHASRRNTKPIARFVSYASRFIAAEGMYRPMRSAESTIPGMRGSARAIRLAIEGALCDAGLPIDDIGLVVSNAAGDPLIDAAEREALESTVPKVPVTAPAAALGHTGAAVGGIGLAVGVLALASNTIPPTLCADATLTRIGFRDRAEPMSGEHVLCLSHTSEGSATAIILAKA
jgi:3-oxoacyl-[acyl-carrier-protein] synthase II